MSLFKKRERVPLTSEERDGQWTRDEVMRHWRTIPDHMKIAALAHATDDQLAVMGWELPNPHDRFLAVVEAKQRRDRPDLRNKIEHTGALEQDELQEWIAPLNAMHGRAITSGLVDEQYAEVFERPS